MSESVVQPSVESVIGDLRSRLETLERVVSTVEPNNFVGGPGQPAFANGWGNFDATGRTARFYRFGGRVFVGGIIASGTSGTTAFTLPVGYRPPTITTSLQFPVHANGGYAVVAVFDTGAVQPISMVGNVASFCFLEFSFRTQ